MLCRTGVVGAFESVVAIGARALRIACACVALLLTCNCRTAPAEIGPAEVLQRFLEAMDRSAHDETALKDAYGWLDERARHELSVRAQRAEYLTGRKFAPWEMIAPGRFRLRIALSDHADMRTTISGDRAIVQVKSEDAKVQIPVPLVREGGRWRVELALASIAQAQNYGR